MHALYKYYNLGRCVSDSVNTYIHTTTMRIASKRCRNRCERTRILKYFRV